MKLILVDGDVVCYNACESRWKANSQGLYEVSERNIDLSTGKTIMPEFSEEEDNEYLQQSWRRFKDILEELKEVCYADDALVAVKGDENFRDYLFSEYKANRHNTDPKRRNTFVPILRRLAVIHNLAIEAVGREADDLLRIWREEAVASNIDYVICSIDKDLKCIPGTHYLMHKQEFISVSEEDAIRFFYEQLLMGDSTDNIKGIPGVGPKLAKRYLAPFSTEDEMRKAVVEAYKNVFDDDWKNQLLINGKLLYIQKHPLDFFTIRGWPDA